MALERDGRHVGFQRPSAALALLPPRVAVLVPTESDFFHHDVSRKTAASLS